MKNLFLIISFISITNESITYANLNKEKLVIEDNFRNLHLKKALDSVKIKIQQIKNNVQESKNISIIFNNHLATNNKSRSNR